MQDVAAEKDATIQLLLAQLAVATEKLDQSAQQAVVLNKSNGQLQQQLSEARLERQQCQVNQ